MINSEETDFELKEPIEINLKIIKRNENVLKFEVHLMDSVEKFLFVRIKFYNHLKEMLKSIDFWHDIFFEGKKKELISFSKMITVEKFDTVECEFYDTKSLKPNLISKHKVNIKY